MAIRRSILAACLCWGTPVTAVVSLQLPFESCPFVHTDSYQTDLNRLSHTIQSLLSKKLEATAHCQSSFASLSQDFSDISQVFDQVSDPVTQEEVKAQVYEKYLNELELEETLSPSADPSLRTEILGIRRSLADNEVVRKTSSENRNSERMRASLKNTLESMNNAVVSLTNMDPSCVDQLGGWQQIVPTVLNAAASLSGLAGTLYSAAIGAGLKVVSSVVILLSDLKAKKALQGIIEGQNSKTIACLFYSVQATSCLYRKALFYSERLDHLEEIMKGRYCDAATGRFDEFFKLQEISYDFERMFFEIAMMGSAVTLDVNLVTRYFQARRARPETILRSDDVGTPPDFDDASETADERRQSWLIKVKTRGIEFSEFEPYSTSIRALREQVKTALLDISNKISHIRTVEKILRGTRSFVDLKHELNTHPTLKNRVAKFIAFLERVLRGEVIATQNLGVVMAAQKILVPLHDFLSKDFVIVPDEDRNSAYGNYTEVVDGLGRRLFEVMSEGAVAQVSSQTVLSIGSTVQDRINRVFQLLDEEFLLEEVRHEDVYRANEVSYSSYKRDHAILFSVVRNYRDFAGSGRTFRAEDMETAVKTIEDGFGKEIRKMVRASLNLESRFTPQLNRETAAHLCALFSLALKKDANFFHPNKKKLYQQCRGFRELPLLKVFSHKTLPIEWDNPCFYFDYQRLLRSAEALYIKKLQLQP